MTWIRDYIYEFDLLREGLLPVDWQQSIVDVAQKHGRRTTLDSRSSTSRDSRESPVVMTVATGDIVAAEIPWLRDLYEKPIKAAVTMAFGVEVLVAGGALSAINVNVHEGIGSHYEWHVDSNPITGVFYVVVPPPGCGGELEFRIGDCIDVIRPREGTVLLFDARHRPHAVRPLGCDDVRVACPMNYYTRECPESERPSDLDKYLYGA